MRLRTEKKSAKNYAAVPNEDGDELKDDVDAVDKDHDDEDDATSLKNKSSAVN